MQRNFYTLIKHINYWIKIFSLTARYDICVELFLYYSICTWMYYIGTVACLQWGLVAPVSLPSIFVAVV